MKNLLIVTVFLLIGMSSANAYCRPEAELLNLLSKKYGEKEAFRGDADGGLQLVLTLSESGTWSVLLVNDDTGKACLKAAGRNAKFGTDETALPLGDDA